MVQHNADRNPGLLRHTHHDGADDMNGHLALMKLRVLDNNWFFTFLCRPYNRHKNFQIRRVKGTYTALLFFRIPQNMVHIY